MKTIRPPIPCATNCLAAARATAKRRDEVDVDDPLPVLERDLEGGLALHRSRVADGNVEPTERAGNRLDGGLPCFRVAQIRLHDHGSPAERLDLRHDVRGIPPLHEAEVGTEPCELESDRPPDPTARARNERNFAVEPRALGAHASTR